MYPCPMFVQNCFVSVANPPAAIILRNFLLFSQILLFCLRGSEPAFNVFSLIFLSFVFSLIGTLTLFSLATFLNTCYNVLYCNITLIQI